MMIKNILSVMSVVFVFSGFAFADDCTYICAGLTFDSDKSECLSKMSNADFQRHACEVCNDLTFSSQKIECVAAIRNKVFSPQVLSTCAGMIFASSKIECLANAGDTLLVSPSRGCDLQTLANRIDGAISNLDAGQYRATRNTLVNMRNQMRACGVR